MAQIDLAPILLTDVLLTLGTDSYEKHVSAVEFVPTSSLATFKGLTPGAQYSMASAPTWQCNITFAQDWETTNSLSRYLLDNQGDTVAATFEPVSGGAGFTADLVLQPGSIGGNGDAVAQSTVTLGVVGAPVYVPAA
jgi:hypothetical protein